jgi:hypothetical protein
MRFDIERIDGGRFRVTVSHGCGSDHVSVTRDELAALGDSLERVLHGRSPSTALEFDGGSWITEQLRTMGGSAGVAQHFVA